MGWIVVGRKRGEDSVLTAPGKRDIRGRGGKIGEAAWVTKIDAARKVDDGWWQKYAWIFETEVEAKMALEILNERVAEGMCSEFNRPEKTWVEEIKQEG